MTSADEVREMVANSAQVDWIAFGELGVWTNRNDVSLRIVQDEQLERRFNAPWTHAIQGGCQQFGYLVYYDNSPVEYHVITSVDDYRAHIPMPHQPAGPNEPYTITPYQATLGRIVTGDAQTFDAYLNRTGIQIQ